MTALYALPIFSGLLAVVGAFCVLRADPESELGAVVSAFGYTILTGAVLFMATYTALMYGVID